MNVFKETFYTNFMLCIFSEMTHNMFGKFHFVDLAGSERAHKTGNVGDRFKGRDIYIF